MNEVARRAEYMASSRSDRSRGWRVLGLLVLGLLGCLALTFVAEARAQDGAPAPPSGLPTTVRVIVSMEPGCVLGTALIERLSTELRTDGVERVLVGPATPSELAREDASVAQIDVSGLCAETLHVRIQDRATEKRVEREVPMQDVAAEARARVAALAVTGLLRASWAELVFAELPDAPESIREGAVRRTREALARVDGDAGLESAERLNSPAEHVVSGGELEGLEGVVEGVRDDGGSPSNGVGDGARADRERGDDGLEESAGIGDGRADRAPDDDDADASESAVLSVGGSVSGRLFFSQTTLIGGLRAWLGFKAIRVGLAAFGGFTSAPAGRAVEWVSMLEFEARLIRVDVRRVAVDVGLRGSLGWARIRGLPVAGSIGRVANDVTFGGELLARLRIPLARVALELTASFGTMLGPAATADGAEIASLGGTMTSLSLGVSRSVRP